MPSLHRAVAALAGSIGAMFLTVQATRTLPPTEPEDGAFTSVMVRSGSPAASWTPDSNVRCSRGSTARAQRCRRGRTPRRASETRRAVGREDGGTMVLRTVRSLAMVVVPLEAAEGPATEEIGTGRRGAPGAV